MASTPWSRLSGKRQRELHSRGIYAADYNRIPANQRKEFLRTSSDLSRAARLAVPREVLDYVGEGAEQRSANWKGSDWQFWQEYRAAVGLT